MLNCADCGKALEEVDFASGRANYVEGTAYCWDCRSSMTAVPPKLIVTMSPVTKRAVADPRIVRARQRKRLLLAGGAALAGMILLIGYLFTRTPPPPAMSVVSFSLISAETRQPLPGFDLLKPGAVITLSALPTRKVEIEARTAPATVGSVRFGLDQDPDGRIENSPPYALPGDKVLVPGEHTLTATPYSKPHAQGDAGPALMIRITIKE